jgi:hypothetical protein
MWDDEILAEIRKVRDEHAKAFNYDLDAIFEDLRRQQEKSKRKIISHPVKEKVS